MKDGQVTYEETDGDVLAEQAYAELEAEKNGTPLPEKKKLETEAEKPSEEKPSQDDSKPSEEKVEEETTEGQEEAKPEDEKPQGEEGESGTEVKKVAEEKPKEIVLDSATINDYAIKNNLTYAEAKDEITKTNAIIQKYKNDPVELAKALRNTQSAYDKTKAQLEQKPRTNVFHRLTDEQFIAQFKAHISKDSEKVLENYRAKYPARTEMMTDEAIIEELADKGLAGYKQFADQKESEISVKATERRDELLNSLAEDEKRFLPDVKAVLAKTDNSTILHPDFEIRDIVHWAKGQRYDADIKEAEERGFKRGKESKVIIGAKTTETTSTSKKTTSSVGWAGTDEQKYRAEEMFPLEDGYTPEKAYEMYKDTFKEELKKNPRFI